MHFVLLAIAYLGLLVGLGVAVLWLRDRLAARRTPGPAEGEAKAYSARLLRPDWEGVAAALGEVAIPAALQALYADTSLIRSRDLLVTAPGGGEWDLGDFGPAERQAVTERWDGMPEGAFPSRTRGRVMRSTSSSARLQSTTRGRCTT
jgi:hypothetical protein